MAAQGIRLNLQRDIFAPNNEVLETFVHVTKSKHAHGKRKKEGGHSDSFLCVSIWKDRIGANITQVKKNEKNIYSKKRAWNLSELNTVDGKNSDKNCLDFDLVFDKTYKWSSSNKQERFSFLLTLAKLSERFNLRQSPQFLNLPPEFFLELKADMGSTSPLMSVLSLQSSIEEEAISPQEEATLEKLLNDCQTVISGGESFTDFIYKKLAQLESVNIKQLIGAEDQVVAVLSTLELAEKQASEIELALVHYANVLKEAQNAMSSVGKTVSLQTTQQNHRLLLETLECVVEHLDVSNSHYAVINNPDLTPGPGLAAVREAARVLQRAIFADFPPELKNMKGIADQLQRINRLKNRLSGSIHRYMSNLFVHYSNDAGDTMSQSSYSSRSSNLSLQKHGYIHNQLLPYVDLIHWLKVMEPSVYSDLRDTYASSMAKLYDRNSAQFFEEARLKIYNVKEKKMKSGDTGGVKRLDPSSPASGSSQHQSLLGIEKDQWSIEVDMNDRKKFDELLESVLSELEPVCLSEQEFSTSYFLLDPTMSSEQDSSVVFKSKTMKQASEETRKLMSKIFPSVETELVKFIAYYEKLDNFYVLYALVRLTQHVLSAQDTGSFLSVTFGTVLIQIKRAFDRFMLAQIQSIQEAKPPKRSKCGILAVVSNFEDFANAAEAAFRGYDRRVELDKCYVNLVESIFAAILRLSNEHGKTPFEVIRMENFYFFHQMMSRLKISALEAEKKEAKVRYTEALKDYVSHYFGQPLIGLNNYFERVQAKVNQGVKESEISYQAQFSKQELRKVIAEYPGKEVKRGLANLYKKVEKDLSEEANLLQIVWRAMQEEFIRQYKSLEEMIQRCYPGALIAVEFTIEDILTYFSDIAFSH
ncbi:exocyst complex component 1-like isoform X1 [Artemia franciscana]|uniref:Exocyst complex component Sec3 PIP2-binding N-terminal domain-containing protein n=1 Tax=Artemia franciscana TaxID=6661 RepID=A0AA88IW11_ARTSF|nr:hypothetical protein QYM36_008126 [Artemia franciscana]